MLATARARRPLRPDRTVLEDQLGKGEEDSAAAEHVRKNGVLDVACGHNGRAQIAIAGKPLPVAVTRTTSGETIIGADSNNYQRWTFVRLRPNCSRDPSFGHNGTASLSPPGTLTTRLNSLTDILVRPNKKLYAVGSSPSGWVIIRLLQNGRPDPAFGHGGHSAIPGPSDSVAESVVVARSGEAYVLGYNRFGGGEDKASLRAFRPDGRIDLRFGKGESVVTGYRAVDGAETLALQPNGHLLVMTWVAKFGCGRYYFRSYRQSGQLVPGFHQHVTYSASGHDGFYPSGMALGTSGYIYVGGQILRQACGTNTVHGQYGALRAYTPQGTPLRIFGRSGQVTFPIPTWGSGGAAPPFVVQSRVGLPIQEGSGFKINQVALHLFTAQGAVDDTFGKRGVASVSLAGSPVISSSGSAGKSIVIASPWAKGLAVERLHG